jgi:hypothetical protein
MANPNTLVEVTSCPMVSDTNLLHVGNTQLPTGPVLRVNVLEPSNDPTWPTKNSPGTTVLVLTPEVARYLVTLLQEELVNVSSK